MTYDLKEITLLELKTGDPMYDVASFKRDEALLLMFPFASLPIALLVGVNSMSMLWISNRVILGLFLLARV